MFGSIGLGFRKDRWDCAISGSPKSKMETILKNSKDHISETHYPIHFMYALHTDHTLRSGSIMTIDSHDRRLDTYFDRRV